MQSPSPRRRPATAAMAIPLGVLLLLGACLGSTLTDNAEHIRHERVRRDASDVTTLYVDPLPGRSGVAPAVGVLSSTARTFVQDGATTEFATQVVGTTLGNGAYAQLLTTSSRVFYDGGDLRSPHHRPTARRPPGASPQPVIVYPTQHFAGHGLASAAAIKAFGLANSGGLYQTAVTSVTPAPASVVQAVVQASAVPDPLLSEPPQDAKKGISNDLDDFLSLSETRNALNNVILVNAERDPREYAANNADRNIDLYKKRQADDKQAAVPQGQQAADNELKPARVVAPQLDLPTFTVRHDFAPSAFSSEEVHIETPESAKSRKDASKNRPRASKALFRAGLPMKSDKKLETVTYLGFVDFTTTVGDTVIIFMPNTGGAAKASRPALDDMPVVTDVKTFLSHSPGMMTRTVTGHSLTMQTSLPTMVAEPSARPAAPRQPKQSVFQADEKEDFMLKSSVLAREQAFQPAPARLRPSQAVQPSETSTVAAALPSADAEPAANYDSSRPTEPLPTYSTRILESRKKAQPLGLLRTIDESVVNAGTTTMYKKSVIGTRVDGTYREVVQTSSRVFFFLDDIIEPTPVPQQDNKPQTIFSQFVGDVDTTTSNPVTEDADDVSTVPPEVTTPENDISNEVDSGKKAGEAAVPATAFITRVVPSTVYKTFTYLTTFFIPAEGSLTTTSVKSREVTSTDVLQVTRVIKAGVDAVQATQFPTQPPTTTTPQPTVPPTTEEEEATTNAPTTTSTTTTTTEKPATTTTEKEEVTTVKEEEATTAKEPEDPTTPEPSVITTTPSRITTTPKQDDEEEEELEVIYKTLYTTYTYLTTFFEEATTSVASREVIVTNVVSSTIDPALFASEAGLLFEDATTTSDYLMASTEEPRIAPSSVAAARPAATRDADAGLSPEERDLFTSVIESVDVEKELSTPTAAFNSAGIVDSAVDPKTYYTTYTYFTTIFVDGETSVSSRTEVHSNVLAPTQTSAVQPTKAVNIDVNKVLSAGDDNDEENDLPRAYLKSASPEDSTEDARYTTLARNEENALSPSAVRGDDDEVYVTETRVTDVTSSTSGGKKMQRKVLDVVDSGLDDQISSESNTEEIEPSYSPSVLLQTSFTTFTYFTTVYKGSTSSDIVSRLETVTNVVTETVAPTETNAYNDEDATLPVTYFTTFTYWTTLYKEGSTHITSREETVSNVVTPTVSVPATASIEITPTAVLDSTPIEPTAAPEQQDDEEAKEPTKVLLEPTTYYTTYTYFTTSYIGDSTILKSRLETVTNVVNASTAPAAATSVADVDNGLGRAIATAVPEQEAGPVYEQDKPVEAATAQPTGLLSTIVTSSVQDGTTTVYSTDVFGTFIDGLYAQVLESTTKVQEDAIEPRQTEVVPKAALQPTGVVSLNEGSIVDADGVTTTFFTTKAVGTYVEQLYAQVVESTSSIKVDEEKATQTPALDATVTVNGKSFRTGLVRLIEGSIVKDQTTTFYESRVIGTLIDGRYAQIIESTSSFKADVAATTDAAAVSEILATATANKGLIVQPTASVSTSPSPDVIESSMGGEGSGSGEGGEEDEEGSGEDDGSGRRGSAGRFNVSQRKRTFTPTIRPFSSRNRPTFLPRRKAEKATSATTITRNLLTPTITATPALKPDGNVSPSSTRGRFAGPRRQSSSLGGSPSSAIDVKPNPSAAGARRFTGRSRSSSLGAAVPSPSSTASFGSGRRASSSRSATPVISGPTASRTRGFAFSRPSSSRVNPSEHPYRASSGAAAPASSAGRFNRIRPTSAFPGRGGAATAHPHIHDNSLGPEDNDLGSTTIVTEETPAVTASEEQETPAPATTTESSRRSNNPLLRFRRPPLAGRAPAATTTAKPNTTPAPRRGVLGRRQGGTATTTTTTTTPKPARPRPPPAIANGRQRPANNLFPKRGLFRKPGQAEEEEKKGEEKADEEQTAPETEEGSVVDNEYEGSEVDNAESKSTAAPTEETPKPGRRGKTVNPVSIKPFVSRGRSTRVRRQVEYAYPSTYRGARTYSSDREQRSNYRRPTSRVQTPAPIQERADYVDYYDEYVEATTKAASHATRFTPRPRAPPQVQQPVQQQQQTTHHRVRPTSASSSAARAQFTLREKSPTTPAPRANFRRPTTSPRRRTSSYETTPAPVRARPPRLRQSYQQTEATPAYSRGSTSRRNGYSNSRSRTSTRGRYRGDAVDDAYVAESRFDGTITVTHKIPSEVTIPVVNGKVTEYKNVLTAKPSLQVLGPHQYSTTVGKDGSSYIQLTAEVTGTQPNGLQEVTKFIVHETPTTSVTFTPTTIRGRKTSFAHVVPSTVYDVETVVSTVTPQFAGANAPLANILLSQLLLGNIGLQPNIGLQGNPLLGGGQPQTPATPTTEFKTKTTTYVTTLTDQTSTVLPITLRGQKIYTTLIDSNVMVITATEFITETVVVTPTASLPPVNNQLNSLLLPALLQGALLQPQATVSPLAPLDQPKLMLDEDVLESAYKAKKDDAEADVRPTRGSEEDTLGSEEEEVKEVKDTKAAKRPKFRPALKKPEVEPAPAVPETSVVTIYVSGRHPGEFSTILSTVTQGQEASVSVKKREAGFGTPVEIEVQPSRLPAMLGGSFVEDLDLSMDKYLMSGMNDISVESSELGTQSLESIVGDVSQYVNMLSATPVRVEVQATQAKAKTAKKYNKSDFFPKAPQT